MRPERIVSGGQTGADRAALDVARALGIATGGWCPRGRRAEDGRIPDAYPLRETRGTGTLARTRRNVADADATLIVAPPPLVGGTRATLAHARRIGRRWLVADPAGAGAAARVRRWLAGCAPRTLNVAGPRESTRPGIGRAVRALLCDVLGPHGGHGLTPRPASRPGRGRAPRRPPGR